MQYRRKEERGHSGWIWIFVLAIGLTIRFGSSEGIVSLREQIAAVWESIDYEAAVETFGRNFSEELGRTEEWMTFSRQLLGFGSAGS